ncbi:hypothetical protein EJB05_25920, partial [Eragrostis curvula]
MTVKHMPGATSTGHRGPRFLGSFSFSTSNIHERTHKANSASGLLSKQRWESSQLGAADKLQLLQTRQQPHPSSKGPLLPVGHILNDQPFKLGKSYYPCRSGITHTAANKFGTNLGNCNFSLDSQKSQVGELSDRRKIHKRFAIYEVQVYKRRQIGRST